MSTKITKNKDKWHKITIRCDLNDGEIVLTGSGRNSYLWVGANGKCATHVSGPATLRALAHAILREVGDDQS